MASALAENILEAPQRVLTPKEMAVVHLRQICEGLMEDYGNIYLKISLHPMIIKQHDICNRMGISKDEVEAVLNEYRKAA